jgi:hypothetical protein
MSSRVRTVEILRFLQLDEAGVLEALRNEGLFLEDEIEPEVAEDLRVAASLMRELGVNPAGVDVALHLRRRLACLEDRMRELLEHLADEAERGR